MLSPKVRELLKLPLVLLWLLLVLCEDLLWEPLGQVMAWCGRWAPVARVERAITRLPPYAAMLLFLLPWAVILPVKLAALWLIASGRFDSGVLLFIAGEGFGMAFLARLYALCRPALHQLAWFVRLEGLVHRWTAWAHAFFDRIPWWRRLKALARLLRDRVHRLVRDWRSRLAMSR